MGQLGRERVRPQLFQGYGDVEGMNVLEVIHKSQVPPDKKVTYTRYTVTI